MTTMELAATHRRLIDGWQRNLPVVARPFAEIGATIGTSEDAIISALLDLKANGIISRVGAAVRPNTIGASMLAAMQVPEGRLEEVAATVSLEPAVNHNYEREHAFNLWFVITAGNTQGLKTALQRLRDTCRLDILELPMERAYYIDLGFPIDLSGQSKTAARSEADDIAPLSIADRRLLVALEDGLSIEPRPYRELATRCGSSEGDVIRRLQSLLDAGVVSRLGLIVRHRALGIASNAMAVWDIDDRDVDRVGREFAASPHVTLCYRRPRRLPAWPYNLFTMVHGRDRETVEAHLRDLADRQGVPPDRRAVLFSRRCFVQRGARYRAA